jgi:multidrug efflux pump subunit AcrA (membrane-fusion protein)
MILGGKKGLLESVSMKLNRHRILAAIAVGLGLCIAARLGAQTTPDNDPRIVRGIGRPSEEHKVSFEGGSEGTSVIKEVRVKPGDLVKAGDVLMMEDTDQAVAELNILAAAKDATGAIEEAKATVDVKTKIAAKLEAARAENSASEEEVLNAELDRDVAIAKKKQAEEDHIQKQLEYEREKVRVDHMTLRSPIDGVVERVGLFTGEAVDANSDKDGACYIVCNDPLWIELNLPAAVVAKLQVHDHVDVAYTDAADKWLSGEVIFLAQVAEYTGQTRMVRVSVANPDRRQSGLPMIVRLPEKAAEQADTVGSAQP